MKIVVQADCRAGVCPNTGLSQFGLASEFCARAEQRGGMVVKNKARIFKVLKSPVGTQESLPSGVKDVLQGREIGLGRGATPQDIRGR